MHKGCTRAHQCRTRSHRHTRITGGRARDARGHAAGGVGVTRGLTGMHEAAGPGLHEGSRGLTRAHQGQGGAAPRLRVFSSNNSGSVLSAREYPSPKGARPRAGWGGECRRWCVSASGEAPKGGGGHPGVRGWGEGGIQGRRGAPRSAEEEGGGHPRKRGAAPKVVVRAPMGAGKETRECERTPPPSAPRTVPAPPTPRPGARGGLWGL